MKITKSTLRQLILNEMAISLKDYGRKVDGLRFELVRNWCLCKWCQLYNPECPTFEHWSYELSACMDRLKFINIKNGIDKRKTLTRMLITDYDYEDVNMIERIVREKFAQENINDVSQRVQVCIKFTEHVQELIDVLSIETLSIDKYIQSTFKH